MAYKEKIHSTSFLDLPWHTGYTDKVIGSSWIQPALAAELAQTDEKQMRKWVGRRIATVIAGAAFLRAKYNHYFFHLILSKP